MMNYGTCYDDPAIDVPDVEDAVALAAVSPATPPKPQGTNSELNAREEPVPAEKVVILGEGDTLIEVLLRADLSRREAYAASESLQEAYDPRGLKAGQALSLFMGEHRDQPDEDAGRWRAALFAVREARPSCSWLYPHASGPRLYRAARYAGARRRRWRGVRRGRNGSFGRYVEIRHNATYTTAYAHLSRYAEGLEPGARVRQGDVIGYVGATGLATGPNLHYEVLQNGKQVDPMKLELPPRRILRGEDFVRFEQAKVELRAVLARASSGERKRSTAMIEPAAAASTGSN